MTNPLSYTLKGEAERENLQYSLSSADKYQSVFKYDMNGQCFFHANSKSHRLFIGKIKILMAHGFSR